MKQHVQPDRRIFYAGEWITIRLETSGRPGQALFRTNLGGAARRRAELIAEVEEQRPPSGRDWSDYPMPEVAPGVYELALPFTEVGVFAGKCCFRPAAGGPLEWPGGDNFQFKVEPARNVAANLLYCAFVRQFRPEPGPEAAPEQLEQLDRAGYTVIPPSGTFRELGRRLDFIFDRLGCRILQLLPIHPTPTVYARMGRFGSPFAALDYFAVDPALAEFDPRATPLEQFQELVSGVHARGGRLFLDIPVNHTGWASKLQNDHPEFFDRKPDGTFVSPGAWGVTWEDLCRLDYHRPGVFELMARVFLHWCRHGVDGFRCDAGYMIPAAAWRYLVARVRREYPDTVFLLEGLGGLKSVQNELLGSEGLDWAYSELFQNYTGDQIRAYFPETVETSRRHGLLIHFAETHDNLRLAATSPAYARMRCALCALLSENGAFGFANGVEFYADRRIDVHGAPPLNWNATPNQVPELRQLNLLLAHHPAFQAGAEVRLLRARTTNPVTALRTAPGTEPVLVLVNLDTDRPATAAWDAADFNFSALFDLLTGRRIDLAGADGAPQLTLAPGEALALSPGRFDPELPGEPERVLAQRAAAMAAELWSKFNAPGRCTAAEAAAFGPELRRDPEAFLRRATGRELPPVVRFRLPVDETRELPVPPGSVLLLRAAEPFRAELRCGAETRRVLLGLPAATGGSFCAVPLTGEPAGRLELHFELYTADGLRRGVGHLRLLPPPPRQLPTTLPRSRISEHHFAFATNQLGGLTQTRARWSELYSKYDALLAANVETEFPADRRVLFTRCRCWLVVNDYSYELDARYLETFTGSPDNRACWRFLVPAGRGHRVPVEIELAGAFDRDAVALIFRRPPPPTKLTGALDPDEKIRLILRPDLEDRPNHELTKAYTGPETRFPGAVTPRPAGFRFQPGTTPLELELPGGRYVPQPEWHYQIQLPLEKRYGQDHATDLFSPGYFEFELAEGDSRTLTAIAGTAPDTPRFPDCSRSLPAVCPALDALKAGLRHFVVKRDHWKTVIAGYPWFLDWGRDTFIALRGLLAAGYLNETGEVIRQFASFEDRGTIPNVIRGRDTGNRDTSDAPLWLIRIVREYVEQTGERKILRANCGGRTLLTVLKSICSHYRSGTPNGIHMDPETGLIFSPAHFTWMDTNYPAATPREGYPIEIQALWFSALEFLGDHQLAATVQHQIHDRFYRPELGFLADCLHGPDLVPDDHLRPNQLFALTLGAVTDPEIRRSVLAQTSLLLIPGAIRTLDSQPVRYELPVWRDGVLLNNPKQPYRGRYEGPEDTSRKVAYHNGTAWCWPFPSYVEAYLQTAGEKGRAWACSLLWSITRYLEDGAFAELPEVADGDYPHAPGGCGAQAWSLSECYRLLSFHEKRK